MDPAEEINGDHSDEDGYPSIDTDSVQPASEQRLSEDSAFTQWLQSRQDEAADASLTRVETTQSPAPIRSQAKTIILQPREYQSELFEQAKKQNTVVVLDTGSGKTLIAALLLRHTVEQEHEDRKQGKPPRISVFLVDKIALAKQQHRVLKENLDCNIGCFAGDTGSTPRTQDYWKEQLEENMVIVCVGAVLLNCLHRSYIKMEQINLLVFDEAHHAKKGHPYARIVTDFYAGSERLGKSVPRIFGMTASPVDAKTDFNRAAADLEGLLHSTIATVGDPSVLRSDSIHQAKEFTVRYQMPPDPFETALCQRLRHLIGNLKNTARLFAYAKFFTSELGPWCADRLWQLAFDKNEDGLRKLEARIQGDIPDIAAQDTAMEAAQAAQDLVTNHSYTELSASNLQATDKVHQLAQLLQRVFHPSKDKCVIFVDKRFTAALLVQLFQDQAMSIPGVNAAKLIGTGKTGWGEPSMTIREQTVAVQSFLSGEVNVLIATTVAEEGLDIPDCNMVIRFDPCNTMIQYVQSRGRARQQRSRLYHMIQVGDERSLSLLWDIKQQEKNMRDFCAALPEDRRVDATPEMSLEESLAQRSRQRVHTVASTGAKLTYKQSLEIIADFVHSLPSDDLERINGPEYIVRVVPGGFKADLVLPDSSPIKSMVGERESSKKLAKCAAAFDMCLELKRMKCLDDWLKPVFTKKLPAMRNKRLALTSTKQAEYPMQVKPQLWNSRGLPASLFMTVLRLNTPAALQRYSVPLALMSRTPMPCMREIPLFLANQLTSNVEMIPLDVSICTTESEVQIISAFTLRVFRDVFSKEYAAEAEKLPYFFAPLIKDHGFGFHSLVQEPRLLLDWGHLAYVSAWDYINTINVPDDILCDKFVIDPHEGSRKFYTKTVQSHIKPSDPQLLTAIRSARFKKVARDVSDDIWNYSVGLWSNSRSRIPRDESLPVVEAEYISLRRNLLDCTEEVKPNSACYLVFQTLKLSTLKTGVVAMAYTLPAIIYRLESNLIAIEACGLVGLPEITPPLALEALTKNSDSTGEHDQEQVNFQQGMGENYERLEFLGDSFLKMGTTIALFARAPRNSEFFQHVDRMVLITNQNLFNNAVEKGVPKKIRSRAFNRRLWYPQGLVLLKGKKNDSVLGLKEAKKPTRPLAAKTIADVCEAMIGAAYLTGREQGSMDLAVRAVSSFVNDKKHNMQKWEDYYRLYKVPEWQSAPASAAQEVLAAAVEEKLGYRFKSAPLIRCAFTHPSYSNILEGLPHYQQLEFLGDALYDMVCVDHLFRSYPGADPQWMTEHKMAMVSNQFLAFLCVSLGLHRHMVSMSSELSKQVMRYVDAVNVAREDAAAEAEALGLDDPHDCERDYWLKLQRPPKALSDIIEAYMGAVFVDSEFDYAEVQRFFDCHVLPHFTNMAAYDTYASKQPITLLVSTMQERFRCGKWRMMARTVPKADGTLLEDEAVCAIFVHGKMVPEHGVAASERYAKIAAAKKFNAVLENMSPAEFKRKYGCDC